MRSVPVQMLTQATMAAVLLFTLSGCEQAAEPDVAAMEAASGAYKTCAACHGAEGQGNKALNAPSLVNLDSDYLAEQLNKFINGQRGSHPQDINGQLMAAQAGMLEGEAGIRAVVAQISGFTDVEPVRTLGEKSDNGQQIYEMICGACHGVEGVGNPALDAPPLRGIDDWYLVQQYESFRNGWRGTNADDPKGQQMQRMGHVLTEEEVRDVAVWLASLGLED